MNHRSKSGPLSFIDTIDILPEYIILIFNPIVFYYKE